MTEPGPKVMPEFKPPTAAAGDKSMGAIEEGGKLASSTVEALKSQPLALSLVIINLLFLLAGGYFLHDLKGLAVARADRQDRLVTSLMERCFAHIPEQR